MPLDGETLADDAAEAPIALGAGLSGPVVASGDGLVLAYGRGPNTVVLDRATGNEQVIVLEDQSWPVALSVGGLRVVVNLRERTAMGVEAKRWAVVEVATGRVEVTVEGEDGWWQPAAVDAGAIRLYRLVAEGGGETAGLGAVALVGHDLIHGSEIGRVEVPGVLAGVWGTGRTWESGGYEEEVMAYRVPGLALSPDGRRVAVVYPAGDAVTMIDARSHAVERTVAIGEKRSAVERLGEWLSVVPREAAAKAEEGSWREAVFGVDGESLYVWGVEARAEEVLSREGVGLQRIDLGTGEIAAEGPAGQEVVRVMALEDGVYVGSWDPGFGLRRLDSGSLAVRAERRFGEWHALVAVRG